MKYWYASVDFDSPLSLEETAACLSSHIFGGIEFGGRDEYVKDEVPALIAQKPILGCHVVIYGDGDEDGYRVEMQSQLSNDAGNGCSDTNGICTEADISDLLKCEIIQIPQFTIRGDGSA